MIEGHLRPLKPIVGLHQGDPGLTFARAVAGLLADGKRLPKAGKSLPISDSGKCMTEILQRPSLRLTGPGNASALQPDPVRCDAVRVCVTPVEKREQRSRKPPGEIVQARRRRPSPGREGLVANQAETSNFAGALRFRVRLRGSPSNFGRSFAMVAEAFASSSCEGCAG